MEELIINCEKAAELRKAKWFLPVAERLEEEGRLAPGVMQELEREIDELEGQVETWREFTGAEVEQRLAEMAEAELDSEKQEKKQLKAELLDVRQDLKEAKKAKEEGLDFDEEIASLEERIEQIKQELKNG